jgi:hypothetical protein
MLQNAMVQDMVGILNCQQRFLPRYGQQQAGQKLPPQTARRLQASLGKDDEALQRRRVETELKHRGGFLPLMAHYPVAKHAAANSSSSSLTAAGTQESGNAAAAAAAEAANDAVQVVAAAEGATAASAAANSSSSSSGVPFSERDKRTCLFVQQYLQQQRKLVASKRVRRQRKQSADAQQAGDQDAQAQQQGSDAVPMDS